MYVCDRCQKGLQVGMSVSHSHIRTKKRSIPNLHVATFKIDGKNVNMRLCTKCIRIVRAKYLYNQEPVVKQEKKVEKKSEVKETSKEPVETPN